MEDNDSLDEQRKVGLYSALLPVVGPELGERALESCDLSSIS